MFRKRAVFLDRDGTVIDAIHRPDFVKHITAAFSRDELKFKPDAVRVMDALKDLGFLRVMITNQPDVAHGYVSFQEWHFIHEFVTQVLRFDDVLMCRHISNDNCFMKKPKPGMLLAAADKHGIDLKSSFMVGDTDADIDAGKTAGCTTILLDAFYNQDVQADFRVANLTEALELIKNQK